MSNPLSVLNKNSADSDLARLYRLQVREQSEVGMFAITTEGLIINWNRGVERIFGYSESEWIGQHAAIIFSDEDNSNHVVEHEMQTAVENGRSADIRWHRRKDGTRIYVRGVLCPLRDEEGVLVGFSKTVLDDTARKHLEDALTQSNSDLQQFAFAASHDLQEPLRTVSIYAEMLIDRYAKQLEGEAGRILQFMLEATGRMESLISDLLAYSQSDLEDVQVTSVFLDEDWETAVSLLGARIDETGAQITHDPLPQVKLDRNQLVRVFQNLLTNSIKFRHPDRKPLIHGWAERAASEWTIRVKDNGIGFAPEATSVIFAPFKRLHSTRVYPGSGIGLAACKRIVEGWGGRIGADSKPGEGSIFWFTLPAVD